MIRVLYILGDGFWVYACVKVVFQASRIGVLRECASSRLAVQAKAT